MSFIDRDMDLKVRLNIGLNEFLKIGKEIFNPVDFLCFDDEIKKTKNQLGYIDEVDYVYDKTKIRALFEGTCMALGYFKIANSREIISYLAKIMSVRSF